MFKKLTIPFLGLTYFIKENKYVYEITMLSACVCLIILNQITDFKKKVGIIHFDTVVHLVKIFIFLQSVTCKVVWH
jgi:hypothetical protein